jgi:hypothetical protein
MALVLLTASIGLAACSSPGATAGRRGSTTTTKPHSAGDTTTPNPPSSTTVPSTSRQLTISTTDLSVGRRVTVSGTGCPIGQWGMPILEQGLNTPFIFSTPYGLYDDEEDFTDAQGNVGAQVGADGRWTMTTTVPMVSPGDSMLTGWCMPQRGPDGATEFTYPGVPVTVTSRFRLGVKPATKVKPGTKLSVTLVGGDCPGSSVPTVILFTGSQQVVTSTNDSTDGVFTLAVPTAAMTGHYQLEADCSYSRCLVEGSFAPTEIVVD